MRYVRDHRVEGDGAILGFERDGWSRYLTLEGERAFLIGGACDTCAFVFERLQSSAISPADVGDLLRLGSDPFDSRLLAAVDAIVPAGRYALLDLEVRVRLVGPCDPLDYFAHESIRLFGTPSYSGVPDNPRTQYWRVTERVLPTGAVTVPELDDAPEFFHLLVPMEPPRWLDRATVERHKAAMPSGRVPAVLGLGVLDVRAPAVVPREYAEDRRYVRTEHWTLATYLIDGHHRVQAAAESGMPIRVLVYLSLDASIASEDQVDTLLHLLTNGPDPAAREA